MSNQPQLSLKKLYSGKVRDLYEIDAQRMLMVASDRLSAFDVILEQPIPDKGKILTEISNFWFNKLAHIIPNHFTGDQVADVVSAEELALVEGRAVVAKRLKPVAVEAIVRGYLVGSGWKEYQRSGTVCGEKLPEGLLESSQLPEPIFTPSTKAQIGDHDENISYERMCELIGQKHAAALRAASLELYMQAAEHAYARGIIIADTKFEFGLVDGQVTLVDEVLTPDSSRFWPVEGYEAGCAQPSFDKQFVRDWLENSGWNKQAPAPELPEDVITITAEKYIEAFEMITDEPFVPEGD